MSLMEFHSSALAQKGSVASVAETSAASGPGRPDGPDGPDEPEDLSGDLDVAVGPRTSDWFGTGDDEVLVRAPPAWPQGVPYPHAPTALPAKAESSASSSPRRAGATRHPFDEPAPKRGRIPP